VWQANTNPKHRDRIAYMRVCSGRFEKGIKVKHSRLRGQQFTIAQAQTIMGADRSTLDGWSYPGDVVGIPFSPGQMAIGDTLYTGSRRISYAKIPSFSPEIFARCINPTPSKYKVSWAGSGGGKGSARRFLARVGLGTYFLVDGVWREQHFI
jgi:peptide chain release factor 3